MAAVAVLQGDPGPRYDGRQTLNPFARVDFVGGASIMLFGLEWSKPVLVEPPLLRAGSIGLIAPFVGLLALAEIQRLLTSPAITAMPDATGRPAAAFLRIVGELCVGAGVVQPDSDPALTSGRLWSGIGLTASAAAERLLGFALFAAAATGVVGAAIAPFRNALWGAGA